MTAAPAAPLHRALTMLGACCVCAGALVVAQTDAARGQLLPTGSLRIGINYGNVVLARRGASGEAASGVAIDVARELARRLGTSATFVGYDDAGAVVDAAGTAWDVAFVGADPARASAVAFTAPYVVVDATYAVQARSGIRRVADVDRPGVRIAAGPRSAYGLFLQRTLKQAEMVPVTGDAAIAALQAGTVTAVAGLRAGLTVTASTTPALRVLPDNFTGIEQALAVPVGNTAAREYLESFVAELKRNGFIAAAVRRTGYSGASAAR
jgi:polar amino acid transport system substrate-binding protein